ncbi:MAG: SDR family oxidoreductase [Almyronema sp.]
MHVFLAGASRGVGREIAKLLLQKGHLVTALLRSEAAKPELAAMGVGVVGGDALDPAAVDRAMLASQPLQAVVSTIGGLPQDGTGDRADYWGNKHLMDAAVKAGVPRFILISSIGAGKSEVALPPRAKAVLGSVLVEKEKAEQYLLTSGLTYTIIRPGGLKSEPATGSGVLTADYRISGWIHRSDVAQLVYDCLLSDKSANQVLSAVDAQVVNDDAEFEVFKLS